MDDEPKDFIRQTAQDYDLSYEIVKDVYNSYPEQFYIKLEDIIKTRAGQNQNPTRTEPKLDCDFRWCFDCWFVGTKSPDDGGDPTKRYVDAQDMAKAIEIFENLHPDMKYDEPYKINE